MMIGEFKDYLTITLAKRLSSPFLATFLFAWCVVNIDILLLVFSSAQWDVKVVNLHSYYAKFDLSSYRVILPLGIAAFYVFIWPQIDMYIFHYTKKVNFKFKQRQLELELKQPVSQEELKAMRKAHQSDKASFEEELDKKDTRIHKLQQLVQSMEGRPTKKEYDALKGELNIRPSLEEFNRLKKERDERLSEDEHQAIEHDLSKALQKISSLEKDISTHEESNIATHQLLNSYESDIKKMKKELEEAKAKNKSLNQEILSLPNEIVDDVNNLLSKRLVVNPNTFIWKNGEVTMQDSLKTGKLDLKEVEDDW